MVKLERIPDEASLLEKLASDVDCCGKATVVFSAGHFPVLYLTDGAVEAADLWGEFSTYSLELACRVGQRARNMGEKVLFVFFADDHSYEDFTGLSASQVRTRRKKFFESHSGPEAMLHPKYRLIMHRGGFDENDVIRHNHGKPGRRDCLFFSEKVLRASSRNIDNPCAREYVAFLENPEYLDKKNSHLISFIPNRCKDHICDVALAQTEGLSASHVFIETRLASTNELYKCSSGVTYRRDP